jgi:two-component system NtrC family sensor kinase
MSRPCPFFLLWSLLAASGLHAQTPVADSLRQVLQAQPRPDTTRVRRLQSLANELAAPDPTQALRVTTEALTLAQQLHDATGEGKALLWLSTLYRRQASYEPARQYAQQAQQLFARQADLRGQGKSYLQLTLLDMMQGNYAPALTSALKGVSLAEKAGDQQTQTRLQATLGTLYARIEDYSAAKVAMQAALNLGEKMGDRQVVLTMLTELGALYLNEKNWALCLRYYNLALQEARQQKDVVNEAIQEVNLADVYRRQGNYAQAKAHALRARALAVANHDAYSLPYAELALALVFQLTNQPDSALILGQRSLQLARQAHSKDNIRDASEVLAKAYAQRGNYASAYRYQRLYQAYHDTLTGEATQHKTSALRYGYELDKKQAQIALLTKTRQLQLQKSARQRVQLYALLVGLLGVVVAAGLLWRNVVLKQRANRGLNEKNAQIAGQRDALDRTLNELKTTQSQLVQREKMASLGELTAGIAHEIQNPLNFVNNFSEVSTELIAELREEQASPTSERELEAELLNDLEQNLRKITQHGQRAASIVRGMLEHSRVHTGERQPTNVNALADEYLRLAYHGLRAKDKSFNATLKTDFAPALPPVEAVSQDIGRVLLNLFTNAFYAVRQRQLAGEPGYTPTVSVRTQVVGEQVLVHVCDNGTGIPEGVQQKIFQPFFTTKPSGEGTGLGLSLAHDIVTKGHGGSLSVDSQEGQGTEFIVALPLKIS